MKILLRLFLVFQNVTGDDWKIKQKCSEMAEKCNSLSHLVNIVYNCFLIMYCIISYCVLCMYLICYLYTIVLTKVTRNKDIHKYI